MMGRPWLRILPTPACSTHQSCLKTATTRLPADQLRGALYGEQRVAFPHSRGRRFPSQTDLVWSNPRVNARPCLASSISMRPNPFHSRSGLQLTRENYSLGRKEDGDAVVA